jgi:hypothetical protein
MKLSTEGDEKLYLNYDGPFTIQVISIFAKLLENVLASENVKRKLYRIFIELAQNLALYSSNRVQLAEGSEIGKGEVLITENTCNFKCTTINSVLKDQASFLMKNCSEINSTSTDLLRAKKKNLYKSANVEDTGAHIGLIMISIYSENPIGFEIIENKGKLYFKISATINKE